MHIQLMGTNVRLPKNIRFTLRLILNLQGHQQNRSLGMDPVGSVELYHPHDNAVDNHSCDEKKDIERAKRLSQALVHLVTARAGLSKD